MNQTSFEDSKSFKLGHSFEDAWTQELIKRLFFVIPKYLYNKEGAPVMLGPKNEFIVLPDILTAKAGKLEWVECKRKPRMDAYEATGYKESLHRSYKRVQEVTGCRVFVVFMDEHPQVRKIYGNFLNEMEKHVFARGWVFQNDNKPHILFKYPEAFQILVDSQEEFAVWQQRCLERRPG